MMQPTTPQSIAVIGGGFYGCVTALRLSQQGFHVTLYEQHSELFQGTSGTFGIRVHAGPHYPRSLATRRSCQSALRNFVELFPSLIATPHLSLYALGEKDAEGLPARVSKEEFDAVCKECKGYTVLNPADHGISGLTGLSGLWSIHEQCIYQDRTRPLFTKLLSAHKNVSLVFNHRVKNITETVSEQGHPKVEVDGIEHDWVVNSTYFRSFSEKQVMGANVHYQVCVALVYEDLQSKLGDPVFMLTIMDGWFPSIEPLVHGSGSNGVQNKHNQYMLYHAKYSILGSYNTFAECEQYKQSITEDWVKAQVRPRMEAHIESFMPEFKARFMYSGYLINTATKLRTATEFRDALVWRNGRVVQQFSGKLTTSISAANETFEIITNCTEQHLQSHIPSLRSKELSLQSLGIDSTCDLGLHRWN